MKIAWLTDSQAPYRAPLWRELSLAAEFEASFVFREETVRHWVWHAHPDYRSAVVPAWTVPLPGVVARRLDAPMAWLKPGSAGRILRGADALIIQNWWQPANLWCAWLGGRRGVPYLLYAESTLQSRRFARGPLAWLRCLVFRHAGAVVVPGPAAGAAAVADGTPRHRVVESVNSIDLAQFDRRVRELRPDGGETGPEHRILYVGQLIERKNVATLIRAFAAGSPKATLDVAGDGVEMDALTALAGSLGVAGRVRFHGHLGEAGIVELLARTHTLVLPSTEEVYGFTALEAYVAGLQVIVSNRAGIAANLEGKNGTWIVEPTEEAVGAALDEARDTWTGWLDDVDVDFASPRRAALDIVRAAELAGRGGAASGRAMVTGASSGLGAAFARVLSGRGYEVVLVGRDRDRLAAVAAGLPGPSRVVVADLADERGLGAVEAALRAEPVDLLVNNAGTGAYGPFAGHDPAGLGATVAVNVTATIRLSRVALDGMLARGRGGVIAVSSLAGSAPQPGMATYSATKAFVDSWTSSMQAELRDTGVTLTCARPGWVRTDFHARSGQSVDHVAEWLTPDEVAERAVAAHDRGLASVVILPALPAVRGAVRGVRRRAKALLRALAGA